MDTDDRIWILMARTLSGEANQAEVEELSVCFKHDPELRRQYLVMKELWGLESDPYDTIADTGNEKIHVRNILKRAEEERVEEDETDEAPKTIWRFFTGKSMQLLYAASIAVAAILFFYHKPVASPAEKGEEVVAVKNGSRTKILLPDGTSVWLNGDSKLFYDSTFNGKVRRVKLVGEAFFDVAKKVNQPFIVEAGDIRIRVLGTAFNVKCYKDDKNIETTLLRGSVEVSKNGEESIAASRILLKPNQKLIVPAEEDLSLLPEKKDFKVLNLDDKLKEDEHIETSWVYNRVEFRGETFEELARKLERWYDIKIVFEDAGVKQIKLNGSFEKETIEEAFLAMQKVASFKFKIYGREIFIKSSE
ncbi:FecR family protein [Pararcticibacter amylolyticus]|uniref:Anti-sigma factor n=1 Tax=Pararcticibacter amylolyticus TaxID=2173175 RepID=A0A2U2PLM6_9SPHI|nr:FecR domain-containing protein [Pararcticibacter amylolyticus]PWG82300.1 hypothetical protein DDR33_00015 [Pararcticibacter amylolyticus]